MTVIVGSARIDEHGDISGGRAGDQTGMEVATQAWYRHSLGWYVLRAKDAEKREMIAQDMEAACINDAIGYDQDENYTLWNVVKPLGFDCSKVTTPCETDCARLVRVCCWYAGIQAADFYTGNELEALRSTGEFEVFSDSARCDSADYLLRGDILVTRSQGHTVVVLNNGSKADSETGEDEMIAEGIRNTIISKTVVYFALSKVDDLKLRLYPSTDAPLQKWDHFNKGNPLQVTAYDASGQWALVQFCYGDYGSYGWVWRDYIERI